MRNFIDYAGFDLGGFIFGGANFEVYGFHVVFFTIGSALNSERRELLSLPGVGIGVFSSSILWNMSEEIFCNYNDVVLLNMGASTANLSGIRS